MMKTTRRGALKALAIALATIPLSVRSAAAFGRAVDEVWRKTSSSRTGIKIDNGGKDFSSRSIWVATPDTRPRSHLVRFEIWDQERKEWRPVRPRAVISVVP